MSEGPTAEEIAKAMTAEKRARTREAFAPVKRAFTWGGAAALLFMGSCGACVYLIGDMEPGEWTEPDEFTGGLFCRSHARSQLKSPSTADFPRLVEAVLVGSQDQPPAEQVWVVRSYVDSQNSFGATIRTGYACVLKPPTSRDESWEIVHFGFDE